MSEYIKLNFRKSSLAYALYTYCQNTKSDVFAYPFKKWVDLLKSKNIIIPYYIFAIDQDDKKEMEKFWWNNDIDKYYETVFTKTNIYKKIKEAGVLDAINKQLETNYETTTGNWSKHEAYIEDYLKNELRVDKDYSFGKVDVQVDVAAGRYNTKAQTIVYGHLMSAIDKAYDVTYLTHELLHKFEQDVIINKLKCYKQESEELNCYPKMIGHAIIQLAADETLSKRLGGDPALFKGYAYLESIQEKIRPYYHKYIAKEGKYKDMSLSGFFADMINELGAHTELK